MDKVYREHQSELREELKRQTDSHNYLLTDALNTQVYMHTCIHQRYMYMYMYAEHSVILCAGRAA